MTETDEEAIAEIRRRSFTREGYRFIVEQLADLNGKHVTVLDLELLIAQARFALDNERSFNLDALRDAVDNAPDAQPSEIES